MQYIYVIYRYRYILYTDIDNYTDRYRSAVYYTDMDTDLYDT